ncbi:MAG: FKBP-type peptidyl-prolyl cis-trans isomerase [Verrucomicrobiae bacterium]|nr:FKBP-type peptidyl-prolyl cis-trans isomerase [Verrucomicrobiae bacterium]
MRTNFLGFMSGVMVLAVFTGCGGSDHSRPAPVSKPAATTTTAAGHDTLAPSPGKETTTGTGLRYTDIAQGSGPAVKTGDRISVHYTGTLTNGEKFDSSSGRGPFTFMVGTRQVIAGWEEGVLGMQTGGRRKLYIPYYLAYGVEGSGSIPPRADLVFEIELVEIAPK